MVKLQYRIVGVAPNRWSSWIDAPTKKWMRTEFVNDGSDIYPSDYVNGEVAIIQWRLKPKDSV